jgi:hypothetical protein
MVGSPVIETIEESAVDETLDGQLRDLFSACFPKEECFRHRRYWRLPPERRWFVRDGGSRLASHACVHTLTMGSDAGDLPVGLVAEVCVRPDFRGLGLVRRMLAELHSWLTANGHEFAMLFGPAEVYSSSGYEKVANVLRSTDWPNSNIVEAANPSTMIRQLGFNPWPAGLIDLRGPIL